MSLYYASIEKNRYAYPKKMSFKRQTSGICLLWAECHKKSVWRWLPGPLSRSYSQKDKMVLLMISTDSRISSSLITSGGANLMISPWVGLARSPLSRSRRHTLQASQSTEKWSQCIHGDQYIKTLVTGTGSTAPPECVPRICSGKEALSRSFAQEVALLTFWQAPN